MRVVFFNIWHGQLWEGLRKFLLSQSAKTDIFCFTEVDPPLQSRLVDLLPGHEARYEEIIRTMYFNATIDGQSVFVKKGIEVKTAGKISIYKVTPKDAGCLQFIRLRTKGKDFWVGNLHGKARPGTKMDTPARLRQSRKIVDFFEDKGGPKIIGGDFNLMPETKSIAMFEEVGYRNLIKEFSVKNTRNEISWEQFDNVQYFADYCFVSAEIKVKRFEVPKVEISDHLPLILDFEI